MHIKKKKNRKRDKFQLFGNAGARLNENPINNENMQKQI